MRRIDENKLNKLIECCLHETIESLKDNFGVEHKYDSEAVKRSLKAIKENPEVLNIVKDSLSRGGWEFSNIIRSENDELVIFATPITDGTTRVREFAMVAGLIGNRLNARIKQGSYNPKNDSETSGVHYIAIPQQ